MQILPSLSTFYELAISKPQSLTFPTRRLAEKYRLRLYNHRRSNKHLPKLTITLEENTITAGPEGWDLMNAIAEASPDVVEAMNKHEKEEDDKINKMFEEQEKSSIKKLEETRNKVMDTLGFGTKKKRNPYENEENK